MAIETDEILSKPVQGFKRIHQEFCKLVDDPTNGRPYRGGACLTPSDMATMQVVFDEHANTGFWSPSAPDTKCALADGLEESFSDLYTFLSENIIYKEELTQRHCPTIANAYTPSTQYHKLVQNSVYWGLLHNEALVDTSGDQLFEELWYVPVDNYNLRAGKLTLIKSLDYIFSDIYMETRMVYSSLGHPHITILSIQPQRAPSREDLLCTEVWTLSYWAHKLARRVLRTTKYSLPVSLNYSIPESRSSGD